MRHDFPDRLDYSACREGIRNLVAQHDQSQTVGLQDVERRFEDYLPEFVEEGRRRVDYLIAFAGKDLVWAMHESLTKLEYGGAAVFLERVLVGIEKTIEDVANWLPEWVALRIAVDQS